MDRVKVGMVWFVVDPDESISVFKYDFEEPLFKSLSKNIIWKFENEYDFYPPMDVSSYFKAELWMSNVDEAVWIEEIEPIEQGVVNAYPYS